LCGRIDYLSVPEKPGDNGVAQAPQPLCRSRDHVFQLKVRLILRGAGEEHTAPQQAMRLQASEWIRR